MIGRYIFEMGGFNYHKIYAVYQLYFMKSSDQGEVQLQLSVTVAQYHENSITITVTLYHKNSITVTVLKKSVAMSQLHIPLQLILYSFMWTHVYDYNFQLRSL